MEIELPQIKRDQAAAVLITSFVVLMIALLHSKFPIFMDEALYSDMVNRFNQGLGLSTPLFRDFIPYVEKYAYWYPPLYFLTLSPIYLIFGASITTGRLFSLLCGVSALILIYFWTKDQYKFKYSVLLVLLILVTDFYFQDGSIVERMEMLTIAVGLAGLFFHHKFVKTKQQKWNLLSGLFSTYSLLTHPTSSIILLPIGLNLLFVRTENFKQKLNSWLIYGAPILLGALTWVVSFWPNKDIFILQNQVQLHRKSYGPMYVIETFKYKPVHRLILSFYFVSNLFFILKIVGQNKLRQPRERPLFFLAFTSSIFPILMKEMWYLVYISVFGSIIFVKNLEFLWKKNRYWLAISAVGLLLILNSMAFFFSVNAVVKNQDDYWSLSRKLSEKIPRNSSVLLASYPDPFFYFEKERPDLKLRVTPNNPKTEPVDPSVYNRIFEDVEYVVLSYYLNRHIYNYVSQNLEEVVLEKEAALGNSLWLIKLKPVEDRQPLELQPKEIWKYPQLKR